MALCGHCFDAKCAEGATQVASPPKKRKKAGGNNKLNLSPADKLKHDNKIKLESSKRKRARAKADNVTLLKLQHECGRLRQEHIARCEEHSQCGDDTAEAGDDTNEGVSQKTRDRA